MKDKIHPNYNEIEARCATCNTTFKTGSILKELVVDTCSSCHPFYTGEQKFASAKGRVDRFNKIAAEKKSEIKKEKVKPKQKEAITDLSKLSELE